MIIKTSPKIYKKLHKQFGVNWNDGIIITYAPNIYWIGGDKLPEEKIVHENTHIRQQLRAGVDIWWDMYCNDEKFRLSQELEAYTNEVAFIKSKIKDKNKRFKLIHQICLDISSSIYGNIISYEEALKLFK